MPGGEGTTGTGQVEDSEKAGTRRQVGLEPCQPAEDPQGAAGGWRLSQTLDRGQGQFCGDVTGQGDHSWSVGLGVMGEDGRWANSRKSLCCALSWAPHTRPHAYTCAGVRTAGTSADTCRQARWQAHPHPSYY